MVLGHLTALPLQGSPPPLHLYHQLAGLGYELKLAPITEKNIAKISSENDTGRVSAVCVPRQHLSIDNGRGRVPTHG